MTSEFLFFPSNPSLNHIKIGKCLLLFATSTNIFTLLFTHTEKFQFCRLPFDVRPCNVKLNLSNIQNELGKAATTWNQLLLLVLWYLTPPTIHHAGVEAVDGPRFNQNQRCVRSGEKWRVLIQLQISATYFFGSEQM